MSATDRMFCGAWIPWIIALILAGGLGVLAPDRADGDGLQADGIHAIVQPVDMAPVLGALPNSAPGLEAVSPLGLALLTPGGRRLRVEMLGEEPVLLAPSGGIRGRAPPETADT